MLTESDPCFLQVMIQFMSCVAQDAKDVGVTECQVYNSYQGTGIAVLTTTYRLFVVNNIDDVRIRRLQVIPGMYTYYHLHNL